jgi:hypothetical protein
MTDRAPWRLACLLTSPAVRGARKVLGDPASRLPVSQTATGWDHALSLQGRGARWRKHPGPSGRPILVLVAPVIDYQKHAAEMDVRKLLGVMGLSNQIAIKPSAQASDVRKGIGAAFERNAEFEAKNIAVSVDGGEVTLSGKVDSYYERTLAENTAWSAPGVTQVKDLITVN